MKNSILTVLAITALVACKKTETTTMDNSVDSAATMSPSESATMPADSTSMPATTDHASTLADQDKKFVDASAKGGMMEVMLGNLAETNASHEKVKAFGKMMVNDHSKVNDALKSWAMNVNYMLPTALDADQQKKVDDLKMKKGSDFDKAYIDLMVNDHEGDIAAFKKQASSGTDATVKSFASTTLPTLEQHLMKVQEIKKALK